MNDFNPDEFLASSGGAPTSPVEAPVSHFDPDQFINQGNFGEYEGLQSKYGTPGQVAKTVGENLLGGLTFNLSKLAENKLGIATPEAMAAREKANPKWATGSQIGGIALGLLGPEELLSPVKGVQLLGEGIASALGGIGGKVAAGALEGGAYGGGNVINDLALGDPNLTAQKALSEIGLGAALGVGGAALSKVGETVLPAATEKLSDAFDRLKTTAFGTAEEPGLAAKGIARTASLLNAKPYDVNLDALYQGLGTGESTIPELTKSIQQVVKSSDGVAEHLASTIPKEIEPSIIPNFPTKAQFASGILSEYRTSKELFQNALMDGEKFDPARVKSLFENYQLPEAEPEKIALDRYLKSSGRLLNASKNYADYKAAEGSISKLVNSLAKDNADVREAASAMVGPEKSKGLGMIPEAVAGFAAHAIGVSNPVIGGVIGALEAYKTLSNPYELGSKLNSTFEKLKVFSDYADKVNDRIGGLAKSAVAPRGLGSVTTGGLIEGIPKIAGTAGYERKAQRITELTANPENLVNHVANHVEDLYEDLPNVSASLQKTMIGSVQFLASKVPQAPPQRPLDLPWKPSEAQKQNFMSAYRTVTEPLSILKDLKSGTVTPQSVEALQATHPELLQEMRSKVAENLNPKRADILPYGVKISLSTFLGEPMDEGMLPSVIRSNQLSFMGPQQSQQNAKKTPRSTLGGLKELSMADRAETDTQEHEEEET